MTETVAATIGALVGGLFVIVAVFIQRGKKVITYEISTMPLLRFKPLNDVITISVDKSVLTGKQEDKGIFEQVNNAYGFQVTLFNAGNEDIEKPNIEIQLDKSAKIISYEIQPTSRPGYDVAIQQEATQPNILRILLPFINKKDKVIIRLISTGNSSKECKIGVLGLGIKYRKASEMLLPFILGSMIFGTLALTIFIFLPGSWLLSIGGYYSTAPKKVDPPIWLFILDFLVTFAPATLYLLNRVMKISKRKEIEWEEAEA